MNRTLFLIALSLVMTQARLCAQDAAAVAPATSASLTPPADNAPVPAPGTMSSTAPASTTEGPAPSTVTTTTVVKTTSSPMSPAEIARVQQQEVIRRQELMFRANQALVTAQKAELGTNYPEARVNYLFAAEAYGSISRSTDSYAKSAEGLTRVDLQLYDDALKNGDTARAKMLIDEILKYNPNNQLALQKEAQINHAIANPNDTSLFGDPSVTPRFVKKVNEVQQLLIEAEQYRRTGQWDLAEAKLKRILGIDPYNLAATAQLKRITAEKVAYDDAARTETRDERLRQVEETWYEPIVNKDIGHSAQDNQPTITRASNFDIDQRLKSIFLSLDFTNATIEEATNYLSIKSKDIDPNHKGVNFIIQPEASTTAKPITLTLNNVPLEEALRYVCQLANVKYKVQDYAISIVPFNQNTDDLISRNFNVQPNFVVPPSTNTTVTSLTLARPVPSATPTTTDTTDASTDPVIVALEAKGVKFPAGASAVYTPSTGQLTVVNTADQMELIEELVNAGQAPTLMVRISTKFVEINQEDLNDVTANIGVLYTTPPTGVRGQNTVTFTGFNTALPGSNGFAPNSIDQLLQPQTSSSNILAVDGFIGPVAYNLVVQALSQKKSFDLLSDPFTIVKSGEQGVVESVRVFPYPIAFDPPQLVTPPTNNVANNNVAVSNPPVVIATTPTDFKRRNVGVRLVVRPQVTADNKTVDLNLVPEVTDFQGFINYGSAIFVGNPDGSQSLLSSNDINQPVFQTRRIMTKVLIHDSSTVVLGGLIRDDMQKINDKVPFLGDLPLVGRMFQSKALESTKRNLIIFVTANIYTNDGELLNTPDVVNAADVLTGHANSFTPAGAQ